MRRSKGVRCGCCQHVAFANPATPIRCSVKGCVCLAITHEEAYRAKLAKLIKKDIQTKTVLACRNYLT